MAEGKRKDKPKAPIDLSQIDALGNLDTARMALRWALERLQSLEKEGVELKKKADWEFKMRARSEEDFKTQTEQEKVHLEESLRKREEDLEREFAGKLADWERDYQNMKDRLQSDTRDLEARERDFDQFCAQQRAFAQEELGRIREERPSSPPPDPTAMVERDRLSEELENLREQTDSLEQKELGWLQERERMETELEEAREGSPSEQEKARRDEERAEELEALSLELEEKQKNLKDREGVIAGHETRIRKAFRKQEAELRRLKKEIKSAITRHVRESKERLKASASGKEGIKTDFLEKELAAAHRDARSYIDEVRVDFDQTREAPASGDEAPVQEASPPPAPSAPPAEAAEPEIAAPMPRIPSKTRARFLAALAVLAFFSLHAVYRWRTAAPENVPRTFSLPLSTTSALVVREGKVFALDPGRGLMFVLSAGELNLLEVRKFSKPAVTGLAWGEQSLWSTDPISGRIFSHALDGNFSVLKTYSNPRNHPSAVYWDGSFLWTSDSDAETITQHSVGKTLVPMGEYSIPGRRPVGLFFADGLLWVFDAITRRIYRYRVGELLSLHDTIEVGSKLPRGAAATGFAVDGGELWIITDDPPEIHRIPWDSIPGLSARPPTGDRGAMEF